MFLPDEVEKISDFKNNAKKKVFRIKVIRPVTQGLRFSFYLNMMETILPIDHVLVPKDFIVKSIELGPKVGSDHCSVFAIIEVPTCELQKKQQLKK